MTLHTFSSQATPYPTDDPSPTEPQPLPLLPTIQACSAAVPSRPTVPLLPFQTAPDLTTHLTFSRQTAPTLADRPRLPHPHLLFPARPSKPPLSSADLTSLTVQPLPDRVAPSPALLTRRARSRLLASVRPSPPVLVCPSPSTSLSVTVPSFAIRPDTPLHCTSALGTPDPSDQPRRTVFGPSVLTSRALPEQLHSPRTTRRAKPTPASTGPTDRPHLVSLIPIRPTNLASTTRTWPDRPLPGRRPMPAQAPPDSVLTGPTIHSTSRRRTSAGQACSCRTSVTVRSTSRRPEPTRQSVPRSAAPDPTDPPFHTRALLARSTHHTSPDSTWPPLTDRPRLFEPARHPSHQADYSLRTSPPQPALTDQPALHPLRPTRAAPTSRAPPSPCKSDRLTSSPPTTALRSALTGQAIPGRPSSRPTDKPSRVRPTRSVLTRVSSSPTMRRSPDAGSV